MEDSATAELSHESFRLLVGMITVADDHGILRASDRYLDRVAFLECTSRVRMSELRAELGRKLVTFYAVEGEQYAHLRGWQKHQRVDNAAEPRLPIPPGFKSRRQERVEKSRLRYFWALERSASGVAEPLAGIGAAPILSGADVAGIGAATIPPGGELPELWPLDHRSPITDHRAVITDQAPAAPRPTLGEISEPADGTGGEAHPQTPTSETRIVPPPAAAPASAPVELTDDGHLVWAALDAERELFPGVDDDWLAGLAKRSCDRLVMLAMSRRMTALPYAMDALSWLRGRAAETPRMSLAERVRQFEIHFSRRMTDDRGNQFAVARNVRPARRQVNDPIPIRRAVGCE